MISKKKSTRPPLTDEQLTSMNASDVAGMKLTSDETARLREINDARRRRAAEVAAVSKAEELPILAELRAVGVDAKSIWDLVNARTPYPRAIPILLKRLLLPYSDHTREGIARSLAVPDSRTREAWTTLVNEYRKAPTADSNAQSGKQKQRLGAKDGLACILAVAVTEETLPELIELAKDRSQGESRLLLLSALRKRKSKNALAKRALDELAEDPELSKEIASWGNRGGAAAKKRKGN